MGVLGKASTLSFQHGPIGMRPANVAWGNKFKLYGCRRLCPCPWLADVGRACVNFGAGVKLCLKAQAR